MIQIFKNLISKKGKGFSKLFFFAMFGVVLVSFAVAAIVIEGIYFYRIMSKEYTPENVDCIIIYPQETLRLQAGGLFAKKGYGSSLSITGFKAKAVESIINKYHYNESVKYISSDISRSTFEDALNALKIVKRYDFNSILIVTSKYHLPRAGFLTKIMLSGIKTKIHFYGVAKINSNNLKGEESYEGKIVIREMIKFWGSIFEMTVYKTTGKLFGDNSFHKVLKTRVNHLFNYFL